VKIWVLLAAHHSYTYSCQLALVILPWGPDIEKKIQVRLKPNSPQDEKFKFHFTTLIECKLLTKYSTKMVTITVPKIKVVSSHLFLTFSSIKVSLLVYVCGKNFSCRLTGLCNSLTEIAVNNIFEGNFATQEHSGTDYRHQVVQKEKYGTT